MTTGEHWPIARAGALSAVPPSFRRQFPAVTSLRPISRLTQRASLLAHWLARLFGAHRSDPAFDRGEFSCRQSCSPRFDIILGKVRPHMLPVGGASMPNEYCEASGAFCRWRVTAVPLPRCSRRRHLMALNDLLRKSRNGCASIWGALCGINAV